MPRCSRTSIVRACRPPARVPASSWLARRSTMATSTPANANSPANISPVGPPPAITTAWPVIATPVGITSVATSGLHPLRAECPHAPSPVDRFPCKDGRVRRVGLEVVHEARLRFDQVEPLAERRICFDIDPDIARKVRVRVGGDVGDRVAPGGEERLNLKVLVEDRQRLARAFEAPQCFLAVRCKPSCHEPEA